MPEGVPKLRGKSQSLKKKKKRKKPEPEESVNLDRAGVSKDSNACNRHRGLGRQPLCGFWARNLNLTGQD